MSYQDKRAQCSSINQVSLDKTSLSKANKETRMLIDLYYRALTEIDRAKCQNRNPGDLLVDEFSRGEANGKLLSWNRVKTTLEIALNIKEDLR